MPEQTNSLMALAVCCGLALAACASGPTATPTPAPSTATATPSPERAFTANAGPIVPTAPTPMPERADIPVGVGLLTSYGFDVDRAEEGWPSTWGIGGWGWNSVVGQPGALWRSFVSNEPAPDFRAPDQTGFYPSDNPQVVDWQARKILEAGFDFVVLDWHGWGDPDLDGKPGPAYIDERANDTVEEWMRWFDAHPGTRLQFAIFVHVFPCNPSYNPVVASSGPAPDQLEGLEPATRWLP